MATPPRPPGDEGGLVEQGGAAPERLVSSDRRDGDGEAPPEDSDEVGSRRDPQVRFGNLKQNLTTHWRVQDR